MALQNKNEFLITCAVILACLVLSVSFPSQDSVEGIIKSVFFMLTIPVLFIKLVLKKNLADFGLRLGNYKMGVLWGLITLGISIAITALLYEFSPLPQKFRISPGLSQNFWLFTINMLLFSNLLLFLQEFFFHGFILAFFSKYVFAWSILAQFMIFFSAIFLTQKTDLDALWQSTPALILSLSGGVSAYKTRSVVYSWISGLVFLVIFSALIISKTK